MGRPKKIFTDKPVFKNEQERKQYAEASKKAVTYNTANAITEALQTNKDEITDEQASITPTDFEAAKEPIKGKQEQAEPEAVIAPGEAERQRLLKQIKERFLHNGVGFAETELQHVALKRQEDTENIIPYNEVEMNVAINKIKTDLALQVKPEFPKMTIEHYKTLKEYERFWLPFKLHGVLNGLSSRELDLLATVMHEVFEPNYITNFWCAWCIGEFLKDLYTYFEKWQEKQKEEVVEYETILKADKF